MEYISVLKKSPLFEGIQTEELGSMLHCLSAIQKNYKKNEFIFRQGEKVEHMGLVLRGTVHIIKENFWGNRTILNAALPSHLFGEAYACAHGSTLEVSVTAAEDCAILLLDIRRLLTTCTSACVFHTRLIRNLLSVIVEKNLMLTQKMEHISKKSTREKLLAYLSSESIKQRSSAFTIPFNRQQLAEYLAVDRSAMSNELSKLRTEGYLTYEKNYFHLNEELVF